MEMVQVYKKVTGHYVAQFFFNGKMYSAGGDSASRAVWQLLSLYPWVDGEI